MKPLTSDQYDELLKMICPYCQYGIPDVRECDREVFVHSIPDTTVQGTCWANRIRGKVPVEPR